MRRLFFSVFLYVCIIVVVMTITACSKAPAAKKPLKNPVKINLDESQLGAACKLPWEDDPVFQEKLSSSKTPVLMAKYRATLRDPLPGEMYNVGLAARDLSGTIVEPGDIFSQNQTLGPYSSAKGYQSGPTYQGTNVVVGTGGGVCKIASLLYNLTVLSDLQVVERHFHSMSVPYVPPGQDATVSYGVKDFKFYNDTKGPILIWAEAVDNTLFMAFYGQQPAPLVTWHHRILKEIEYWPIYKFNQQLRPGEEKVVIKGQNGYVVRSWVTILDYKTGEIETKSRGVSYYNPMPEVIEKGP